MTFKRKILEDSLFIILIFWSDRFLGKSYRSAKNVCVHADCKKKNLKLSIHIFMYILEL